jgi:hypothetical protein
VRNIHKNALRATLKVVARCNSPGQAIQQRAADRRKSKPLLVDLQLFMPKQLRHGHHASLSNTSSPTYSRI